MKKSGSKKGLGGYGRSGHPALKGRVDRHKVKPAKHQMHSYKGPDPAHKGTARRHTP